MKGFVIAGTGSGSGKTTITLGILAYLSKIGYKAAPFKIGPDFIDPGHHRALTGKVSHNLDSWMLSKQTNEEIFFKGSLGADVAVVEGVMGLFDGYSGSSEAGSTAQMAKWLNLPVILVIDAKSMARSAAAIVKGFETFDSEVEFIGVIFNKTGSQRHYDYLKEAVEANSLMRCLGHIPRDSEIVMPERHLGLVTSDEHNLSSDTITKIIDLIHSNTSIKEMVENLPNYYHHHKFNISQLQSRNDETHHQNIRIAAARDKAFCFYYQENIEALQRYGAEIVEFSPIESQTLPSNICGIYFGGGYPELFAEQLSNNKSLLAQIKQSSLDGMPIYGECGGFMYLCRDIICNDMTHYNNFLDTKHIIKYPMAGCFPFSAVMSKKMRSLGYRQITLNQDTVIGKKGDILRGHEFHYSSLENVNQTIEQCCEYKLKSVYDTASRDGQELLLNGFQINNTLGSYLHLHFESMKKGVAQSFVNACSKFSIT